VKTTPTQIALVAASTLSVVALQACAQKVTPPPPPTVAVSSSQTPGGGVAEEVVTISATVKDIDLKSRTVTLLGPDGKTTTVRVSDEARNLDQVKKGDIVTAAFYESVSYEVRKKGTAEPGKAEAVDAARAPVGAKPGGIGAAAVTVTATITAIDKKNSTVTLKGPEGKTSTIKVKDPSRLDGVKVGDLVEFTFTEAVAISVDKAPKS
jgi:Cu/Ag efflux protein CusF